METRQSSFTDHVLYDNVGRRRAYEGREICEMHKDIKGKAKNNLLCVYKFSLQMFDQGKISCQILDEMALVVKT